MEKWVNIKESNVYYIKTKKEGERAIAKLYNNDNKTKEYASLISNAPLMKIILEDIVKKRNNLGWDAECCALMAESVLDSIKNDTK